MPELPEVETIKTAIEKTLKSAEFIDLKVENSHLRQPVPSDLTKIVVGQKIIGYQRIAKYILIHLDNGYSIVIHLGMSGRIRLSENYENPQKHDHIIFKTTNGYMIYNDSRRFGLCIYIQTDKISQHSLFKNIGIDPFDEYLSGATLKEKLIKKSIPIKIALLDQSVICGIGNIYASESLFLAGILPTRKANSLSIKEYTVLVEKIRQTLRQAIAAGGSTLRDYRQPDGGLGYFQNQHCVYNKTGQACPSCTCQIEKTGGIQKSVLGGRSTYFCKTKQR